MTHKLMRQVLFLVFSVCAVMSLWSRIAGLGVGTMFGSSRMTANQAKSIFEFDVEKINGSPVSLADFKGKKAYLIVNVASK